MFAELVVAPIFAELVDVTVDVVISNGDEYEFAVAVDVTFDTVTTGTGHFSIENVVVVAGSSFGLGISSSDEVESYLKTVRLR